MDLTESAVVHNRVIEFLDKIPEMSCELIFWVIALWLQINGVCGMSNCDEIHMIVVDPFQSSSGIDIDQSCCFLSHHLQKLILGDAAVDKRMDRDIFLKQVLSIFRVNDGLVESFQEVQNGPHFGPYFTIRSLGWVSPREETHVAEGLQLDLNLANIFCVNVEGKINAWNNILNFI